MSDESSAAGDFLKDLRGAWSNRIANPLAGSFALSWVAVNYRTIVVLISASPFKEKFSYIDSVLYPNIWYVIAKCFLVPLSLALLYIYALPKPTERVYQRALRHQRELNIIARSIAEQRLLSEAQSKAILDDAEEKVSAANLNAAERIRKAEADGSAALKLAEGETTRAAQELASVEKMRQTHLAELSAHQSEANVKISELEMTHRAALNDAMAAAESAARQTAGLRWALTYEKAISAANDGTGQLKQRLFALLIAKEVTLLRGSGSKGSLKFTTKYGFTDLDVRGAHDWLRWDISDQGRIAIYNTYDAEVASFLWRPVEQKWQGTIMGQDASLHVQRPTD